MHFEGTRRSGVDSEEMQAWLRESVGHLNSGALSASVDDTNPALP